MWVDGRIYYGMWKDGHQHGEGTIVLPNMSMKKSYWENGKETTRLKLAETEKEQIAKYVKEMQADDAEERKHLKLGGGLTRSQSLKRKSSSSRRTNGLANAVASGAFQKFSSTNHIAANENANHISDSDPKIVM